MLRGFGTLEISGISSRQLILVDVSCLSALDGIHLFNETVKVASHAPEEWTITNCEHWDWATRAFLESSLCVEAALCQSVVTTLSLTFGLS